MAMRIEEPDRLRAAMAASYAFGLLLIDGSGATGLPAWSGVVLFCVGTALLDGLGEGKVGWRQAGVLLFLAGIATATWALLVIFLTLVFLEQQVSAGLFLLLGFGVALLVGGVMLRRAGPIEAVAGIWARALRASLRSSEQREAA